jgi:hypothetical protein
MCCVQSDDRTVPHWYTRMQFLVDFSPKKLVLPSHLKKLQIKVYKTVILLVLMYGCETWSLTLKEEHRLSFFENKC